MSTLFEDTIRINKSRPPLRWIADLFGDIAGWAILRMAYLDESQNFGIMYQFYSFIWRMTWPLYNKFGTVYKWNFDTSTLLWDYEDEETGDAFRLIEKEK